MIGETFGNFRVVSRVGRGGMGEVYLAEQQSIGTRVAVKVLHADISQSGDHVQRFFNEARAVSRIQHSGIVKIFDCGMRGDLAYLVMEFLDGESLRRRISRGALSLAQVCDVGRQIASVLDATHAAGITHRDLKPDNIYLVPDRELASKERVKVLDFGIAKLTGTLAGASPRTTGTMGTPAYMAPEQWGDSSKVDWRADVYALGCVAFEMATGQVPFPAQSFAEACAKHLSDPPPVANVHPELDRLLLRMLAKDPAQRPQSMLDVAIALEAIGRGAGSAISAGPTAAAPQYAATVATADAIPRRSNRLVVVVVLALALVASAAAAVFLFRGGESSKAVPDAAVATVEPDAAPSVDAAVALADAIVEAPPVDPALEERAAKAFATEKARFEKCYRVRKAAVTVVISATFDAKGTNATTTEPDPTIDRCLRSAAVYVALAPPPATPFTHDYELALAAPKKPAATTSDPIGPLASAFATPDEWEANVMRQLRALTSTIDRCRTMNERRIVLRVEVADHGGLARIAVPIAAAKTGECVSLAAGRLFFGKPPESARRVFKVPYAFR